MSWTPEQAAILAHRLDAHAVVRAAPGAGKTTTLVGRVRQLITQGVDPRRVRVVMFNKSIQTTFSARLGVPEVRVTTFDALGYEVLRAAERRGLLSRPLQVCAEATIEWARQLFRGFGEAFESPEDIANAVTFWKAHLVPPKRAAFPSEPVYVEAYRQFEALRLDGDALRVAFEDMVYTAVGVLGRAPGLLGPIDHLLIDEFQDVNPARIELVRRLIQPTTALMAVGDEDQGINEWCGAHPRFLRDFAQEFPNLPTVPYTLSRSFRFGEGLATVANQLIRHNVGRSGGVVVGGGASRGEVRDCADPAVTVRKLVAEGVAPKDIAVLYRGRTQAAAVLAGLAIDHIPMRTDDIGLLRKGKGPDLALAYLHFAVSDAPVRFDEAWPIVFGPERYIQKEPFQRMVAAAGKHGLKAMLRDKSAAVASGQGRMGVGSLKDLGRTLERMARAATAGKALDLLLEDVDIEAQLKARLRSEKDQDLAIASFHAVHALLRGMKVSPAEARGALETLDAKAGQAEEACVWVSTIHKAKGMEWRHVVLPGLLEGACPAEQRGEVPGTAEHPHGVPQSPWMEQERRIFYVGLTRAIEVTWLHAPADAPSRFVAELRGQIAAPGAAASLQKIVGVLTHQEGLAPAVSGRRWTAAEDATLEELWEAGRTCDAIAGLMGRSSSAIAARLVRLELVDSREDARGR